ncbi:hypothetical protein FGM01_07500 [Christiangramia sabulilitoris]|uniref:DUF4198 domain-containing protein n=1 Tax=Christiangramia sabulilitoris TaxID=2583991 RepID=A0A550I454_9FLAO|nr:hypothetical protein FGM01_07500 [Christiangramia sabulilitoris]
MYRLLFILSFLYLPTQAFSQETSVMIRAKAKDAKFIGSSIGGAKVLVKETLTGKILAEGITTGSTGNTEKIMKLDHKRGVDLSDNETAGFLAKLEIDEPKFVTVEVFGPVNKKQAVVLSSTQLWVIPGKNITGDGIVLEIPGFIVDILSPQTHERIDASAKIKLAANVVMMCGCPVTEDGIWDAHQYEVKAVITGQNDSKKEIELEQKEKASTFTAEVNLEKGLYELLIYAYDPLTGNTGVDKTNIIIN